MRTSFRPRVEPLEALTLLSQLAPTPPVVPAAIAVVASPLNFKLTTDHATYTVGEPIHFTLTVTNTSAHAVQFVDGPSIDGFVVRKDGKLVWQSNSGPQPQFLLLVTLQPGKSYTLHATWKGAKTAGTYDVANQLDPHLTTTFTVQPASVTAEQIPAPDLVLTLVTNHTSYRLGQPVTATLTETNRGTGVASVFGGTSSLTGLVSGPHGEIWVYNAPRGPFDFTPLNPGQSRTFTIVWPGQANLPGTVVAPGTYTFQAGVDALIALTSFHVTD